MRRNYLANLPGRLPFNLMHDVVKSDVAIWAVPYSDAAWSLWLMVTQVSWVQLQGQLIQRLLLLLLLGSE